MIVGFDFCPFSESVEQVMEELIRDLEINKLRKDEMVEIFRMKLMELNNGKSVTSNDMDKLDVIEMIFDHDANNLKFKLNGKDYEEIQVGYTSLEGDGDDYRGSYRMGVTFDGHPNEIELFDYRQLKA